MGAVAQAIQAKEDGIQECTHIWQNRRDVILEELGEYTAIIPQGGWSLLVDVSALGMDGRTASIRLLELSKVAGTPMVNWI